MAADAEGRRRLDNPADWVRLEVDAALNRKVPVVPVLVEGAAMPKAAELPESMAELAYRNAVDLSDTRWRGTLHGRRFQLNEGAPVHSIWRLQVGDHVIAPCQRVRVKIEKIDPTAPELERIVLSLVEVLPSKRAMS